MLSVISLLLLVIFAAAWFFPSWNVPLGATPLLVVSLSLSLLAGLAAFLIPLEPSVAARTIDQHHHLPDSAISSYELSSSVDERIPSAWRKAQAKDTVKRLRSSSLPRLRWQPLGVGGILFVAALLLALIPPHSTTSVVPPTETSTTPDAAKLDLLFEDWEKAASTKPDPALNELLAAIEPFRNELQQGNPSLQSIFVELSKIDERLASTQEALKASSLDSQSGKLAEALKQMGGVDALAESISEKSYDEAAEAARQIALAMNQTGTGAASLAINAVSRKNLQNLSAELATGSHQQMSKALQQLSQSNSSEDFSQALQQMSEALDQESSQQQAQRHASLQRMQLASAKEAMEKGQSSEAGLSLVPSLSVTKQEEQGKGAGAEDNTARSGALIASTPSGAPSLALKGVPDSLGESTVSTVRASNAPRMIAPTQEGLAPSDYQRLSLQAIEDENLPLAHRLAIRRYFEMIRAATPTSETP